MTALYRSGRQADALARYRDGRRRLVDELGIEPGVELRSLEQSILQHDPDLAPPSREVVPTDPIGSTPRRRRVRWGVATVAIAGVVAVILAGTLGKADRGTAAPVRGAAVAVVDAASGRLLGSVAVDSPPAAIAAEAGSIWVSFPAARSLVRLSPESRRVVATVQLDRPAASLATAAGDIWAVGSTATDTSLTLDRIDPTFDAVARVRRLPMAVPGDTGSVASAGGAVVVAPRSGF